MIQYQPEKEGDRQQQQQHITMGNTLRSPISVKRRRSEKRKGRKSPADLSGMEIMVDPHEAEYVSEAFDLPDVGMADNSQSTRTDAAVYNVRSSQNSTSKRLRSSKTSCRSSRTSCRSSRSSQRPSLSQDLMTCIIPGMDPSELLQLVEECAEEERREMELEESVMRMNEEPERRRSNGSRRRSKNGLGPRNA